MPFRLSETRAKIQFITSARMPHDIYKACLATGCASNTVYIQRAVCAALARDLHVAEDELLDALPPPRGSAATIFGSAGKARKGMQRTNEEVT